MDQHPPTANDEPIVELTQPFGAVITSRTPGSPLTSVPIDRLREAVSQYRVVVLRGFDPPRDADDLLAYGQLWGDILRWSFGAVFDVLAHAEPEDHAYDTGFMPMHWDGMYAEVIPQHQIFHCVTAPPTTQGGRTLFCDTVGLLAAADPATVRAWSQLTLRYQNPKLAHYGGMVVAPLIEPHPITGAATMRFLEPVPAGETILNPPTVHVADVSTEREAQLLTELSAAVRDPRYIYAHTWHENDIVITDNHALLHTREAYARGLPRHLRRVHVLGEPPVPSRVLRPATAGEAHQG